jgi:DNA-binding response OmpR family regulator
MKDGKHVILYVEDDPDYLDSMRLVLEANGYVMIGAESAEAGIKAYKEHRPDFIIVDLMMEEVDAGTRLVRDLRAAGNTAPVYMLSSVGDQMSMVTDTTELGLAGVFQKPIDHKTLLRTLEAKLKR